MELLVATIVWGRDVEAVPGKDLRTPIHLNLGF
jgi:hypothetical protein